MELLQTAAEKVDESPSLPTDTAERLILAACDVDVATDQWHELAALAFAQSEQVRLALAVLLAPDELKTRAGLRLARAMLKTSALPSSATKGVR